MAIDLLISSDPWENRVALLEDGVLAEIYIERDEKVIGSIFKGKVQNVLPGMGASFVDIGLGRNAFLYVDDINKTPLNIGDVEITQGRTGWTINEKVNRGDDVLVQIVKEPRGLKGARISTNISLPGRYLILMPTGRYSGVSRKIESADERNRLKGIMKRIRPDGMATVVRTAAAGVSDAELMADLGVLIRMWHGILEQYKVAPSPALLHKDMNLVYKAARDFITPEVEHVYIDDEEEFEKVRDFMRLLGPQYLNRLEHYNSGRSLFKDFKIDEELQKLLRSKVNLPSGGSIVIETTEALTVIDVNSGKFTGGRNLEDTIVKTNVEAATEIARQVRLRDIGGIIVCDFIDMNTEASRTRVLQTLEAGLRKDRTRTTIQSFSALGLLEFTRKRVGKDLAGQLRSTCPTCHGAGGVLSPESVAIETFRRIRLEAPKQMHAHALAGNGSATHEHVSTNGSSAADAAAANGSAGNGASGGVYVEAAPNVAAQIEFWYEDDVRELSQTIGAPIHVEVDRRVHPEAPRIGYGGKPPPDAADSSVEIRVGDEFDVTVLPGRVPTPNAALAVVAGRLVEIENGAGAIGQRIKIRILDVDGDDILAEPRAPVPGVADLGERRKRRRRGGRGRTKPLTIEEQTDELLELAEEAQRGLGGRTSAIGISTAVDAEMEDASVKAGATQKKVAELEAGIGLPDATVALVAEENGEVRRRRRRRRRGRRAEGEAVAGLTAAEPSEAVESAEAGDDADDDEDDVLEAGTDAVAGENEAGQAGDENRPGRRRRRRRRRRRGAPGETAPGIAAVPDRHIFRVGADGETVPTGETAPPEPVRAIAQVDSRRREVAVEPPPPSLSAPVEATGDVKRAKPSRRRPTPTADGGQLEFTPMPALPAAASEPEPVAPKRRGRVAKAKDVAEAAPAVAAVVEAAPAPAPRRTRKAAAAAEPAAAEPVVKAVKAKRRTAAEKAADEAAAAPARPARRTAARKVAAEPEAAPAPKRTTAARKRTAAEAPAAPAARKRTATATRKAPAAKKTSRKKS